MFKHCLSKQPLDDIRSYYGEKIALYFAFCGSYTTWLILFSIVGVLVMVKGLATAGTSTYVAEMCAMNKTMCPSCDDCDFWNFNSTCSVITSLHYFENNWSLPYAFIISIWAVMFLECWQRKNALLSFNWDLERYDEEEEPIRARARQ